MRALLVTAVLLLLLAATGAPSRAADRNVRREVQRAVALKDPKERVIALEDALRGADDGDAAEAVLDLVFDPEQSQAALGVGIRALGKMTSSGALDALSRAVLRPQRLRRILAAEALGRSTTDASRQQLMALARTDDPRVRAAAVTSLGDRHEDACAAVLAEALRDPEWTVRSAAIRGLRVLGGASAAALLAEQRPHEDGRLLDDLADALREVTAALPKDGAAPADPQAPANAWTPPPPSFRSPIVETRSRRILFVLSTAETMKDPVHGAAAEPAVVAGVAAAGQDLADDLAAAKNKLDLARVHLQVMIRTLAEGVSFDVMTYAASPVFAFGQLVPADDGTRRKAESRIARLSPGGAPNVHDTLHRIFDSRGKDPYDAEDGVDTVVFLSDGTLPSNLFNDRNEVAPRAVRWNRARQIRFVTVAVGQSEPYLLGSLAGGPPPGLALSIP